MVKKLRKRKPPQKAAQRKPRPKKQQPKPVVIATLEMSPASIAPTNNLSTSKQFAWDSNTSFVNQQLFYARLKREERLHTFEFLYDNFPLIDGVINVLTNLANTPMYADTGDAGLDRDVNYIFDKLGMAILNPMIDRFLLVYGFNSTETVLTDSFDEIARQVVIPSLETRYRTTSEGLISSVVQLPRGARATAGPQANVIDIPPDKCSTFVRCKMGLNDHYGRSIIQTSVNSCDAFSQFLDIQLKVYRRFGMPRYVITVDNANAASEEQYKHMLLAVAEQFKKAANDNESVLGPPGTAAVIIGSEGSTLRWKDETALIVSNILAATGVPSSLVNFNVGGVTESYSRQQVLVMTNIIRSLQQAKAQSYLLNLCPIISAVYGLPPIRQLRFDPPRLLEEQQEQLARKERRALDWQDTVDGLISPQSFSMRQDVPEVYDIEALKARIEQARQMSAGTPDEDNVQNDGQTKMSDANQSNSLAP